MYHDITYDTAKTQCQEVNQILESQQTPHTSRSRANYGVSVVRILEKIERVITAPHHYDDVTMSLMASQITSLTIVYSTVYSGADQRKLQSSASLVFVRGIHQGPVNSPHKRPVTRKMFPFDDAIMLYNEQPLLTDGTTLLSCNNKINSPEMINMDIP